MKFNFDELKNDLTGSVSRGGLIVKKYSPEILLGAGCLGLAATIFMTAKATLKASNILDEHHKKMAIVDQELAENPDKFTDEDKLKTSAVIYVQTGLEFAKLYGPSFGMGLMSFSAILWSHGIMANRQVALIGAYNLLGEAYKSYRARVVEDLGEEVDKNYHLGLKDETHTETEVDEEGKKTKVKKTTKTSHKPGVAPSIYSRFFDESNPFFGTSRLLNKSFLIAKQNWMNDQLILNGHVFLNQVYQELGFPHTKEGQLVGWVLKDPKSMRKEKRDGHIDFGIFDVDNDPAREFVNLTNPTILLDFNVDGIILDEI